MGGGREGEREGKITYQIIKKITFFLFLFFLSKTAVDGIYRDGDGKRSLADQWITARLFDISRDGVLHLSSGKCKKTKKTKLWMQTGLDGYCNVFSITVVGEPSSWTRFLFFTPGQTWRKKSFIAAKLHNILCFIVAAVLSTFWSDGRASSTSPDDKQVLPAWGKLPLLHAAKRTGCRNRVIDLLLQLRLALEAWSINSWLWRTANQGLQPCEVKPSAKSLGEK